MPGPVSSTVTSRSSPRHAAADGQRSPWSLYLTAFSTRLVSTCTSASRSACAARQVGREVAAASFSGRRPADSWKRAQHLLGHLGRRHRLQFQRHPPRLHPAEVQQVLHQQRQPLGVPVGDGQEAIGLRRILGQHRPGGLHRRAHRRQRRAQLVRDVGHEVLAHALQPPDLRDVHQHHQRPRRRRRPAGWCAPAAAAAGADPPPPRPTPAAARSGSCPRWRPCPRCAPPPAATAPPAARWRVRAGRRHRSRRPPPTAAAPGRPGWPWRSSARDPPPARPPPWPPGCPPAGRVPRATPARWRSGCRPADPGCWPAGRSRRACPGRMRTSRLPSAICRAAPVMARSDRPNTWLVTSDSNMATPSASAEVITSSSRTRRSARSTSTSGTAPRTITWTLLAVCARLARYNIRRSTVLLRRWAQPLPLASAASTSGPAAVVLHLGQIGQGDVGIAQHLAVHRDERHPGPGGRPRQIGQRVPGRQLIRRQRLGRQPAVDHVQPDGQLVLGPGGEIPFQRPPQQQIAHQQRHHHQHAGQQQQPGAEPPTDRRRGRPVQP